VEVEEAEVAPESMMRIHFLHDWYRWTRRQLVVALAEAQPSAEALLSVVVLQQE